MANDTTILASRLNNRITFQKKEKVRQPNGSYKDVWGDHTTTWAEVITIGGEEGREAASQSMTVKYRITIRYRGDITPEMQIRLNNGAALPIRALRDPNGIREILEITAESIQGSV